MPGVELKPRSNLARPKVYPVLTAQCNPRDRNAAAFYPRRHRISATYALTQTKELGGKLIIASFVVNLYAVHKNQPTTA
jgi:hypothetical protein